MIKVFLLKPYQGQNAGEIISVSNNVAFGLVENGTARRTEGNDYMIKSELGRTRAFGTAPSRKRLNRDTH